MIRQQEGDFLEIEFEGKFYYVIVLTKIRMFGGNILYAFHTNGEKQNPGLLLNDKTISGFNLCADLLLAKRQGKVKRISNLGNTDEYWKSKYAKSPRGLSQNGEKEKYWKIYDIRNLENYIETRIWMTPKYKKAMDRITCSFDVAARLILEKYLPEKNKFLRII